MRTTIDAAGRIVIPKPIRDRVGLHGGQAVEVTDTGGQIEIARAPGDDKLIRGKHGLLVFESKADAPPITLDDTLDAIDRSRGYPREHP